MRQHVILIIIDAIIFMFNSDICSDINESKYGLWNRYDIVLNFMTE